MHDIGIDKMYNVWHANENNILIYFHDGDGSVVFVDKIYPIQKGAFCFIPSRKQHYTIPADTYTYNRSKIMITDELLNNILAFDRNTNLSVFNQVRYANLPVESQKKIEGILAELEEQDSDSRGYYFLYISAIFRCFSILNANETKDPDLKIDLVVRVMEYVHSHINQPISIEQICSYLNFNKYYVCHKFKSDVDRLNYLSADNVFAKLDDKEKLILIDIYSCNDTMGDNVYKIAKMYGINQDKIWTLINKVSNKIAKERKLI